MSDSDSKLERKACWQSEAEKYPAYSAYSRGFVWRAGAYEIFAAASLRRVCLLVSTMTRPCYLCICTSLHWTFRAPFHAAVSISLGLRYYQPVGTARPSRLCVPPYAGCREVCTSVPATPPAKSHGASPDDKLRWVLIVCTQLTVDALTDGLCDGMYFIH